MKSLSEYICEAVGKGISDDALWYRLAKYKLTHDASGGDAVRFAELRKCLENHERDKVIAWMKEHSYPFMKPEDEIIPRSEWDLDVFDGPSLEALHHPHIKALRDHIYKNFKPKSNIMCMVQCSHSKPYGYSSRWKSSFDPWSDYVDFFASSVSGAIPKEFSNYYPCRYTEWGHQEETEEEANANSEQKMKWIVQLFKKCKYDKMIVFMQNEKVAKIYKKYAKENIEGMADKIEFVVTPQLVQSIADEKFNGSLGLAKSRLLNDPKTRHKFTKIIRKYLPKDKLEGFDKLCREREENYKNSKKTRTDK